MLVSSNKLFLTYQQKQQQLSDVNLKKQINNLQHAGNENVSDHDQLNFSELFHLSNTLNAPNSISKLLSKIKIDKKRSTTTKNETLGDNSDIKHARINMKIATSHAVRSNHSSKSRRKRGILGYGHDSINPFEDARIFLFNPLCCFGWKAADMEVSNMKNWLRDIRTTVG